MRRLKTPRLHFQLGLRISTTPLHRLLYLFLWLCFGIGESVEGTLRRVRMELEVSIFSSDYPGNEELAWMEREGSGVVSEVGGECGISV